MFFYTMWRMASYFVFKANIYIYMPYYKYIVGPIGCQPNFLIHLWNLYSPCLFVVIGTLLSITYSLSYFFVLSLWHACATWHVPHSCLSLFPPTPHKPNSLNFSIYTISCFGATKGGWPLVVEVRKPYPIAF
jgi:hypothetical protein